MPACLAGLQAHTQGGVEGSGLGEGGFQAHILESLQAHTLGGLQAHTRGGGGFQAHTQVVFHHALRQTPQQTATGAGGRHPIGMQSCSFFRSIKS